MDGVKVVLGNRGMTVEAAHQCTKDQKEWRALVHKSMAENKSLKSAILDLGEQMQMMEQMLQDFCQKYAPINNPQSEIDTNR